ncbi:N-acetylglucosaminyldiphosphodolichol N-acetylglucosaminyltransferase catalytic subunit alg13 [Puttea exsequens]|nr:N-acetylglucosaminyldiphosphodolichol N-acetylglucosaminyltransferase catalytic subunit alg13 [Puttea exsequens]
MSKLHERENRSKVCFVTIGATASFNALIRAVLSPPFLDTLRDLHYTDLRLQHGEDGRMILDSVLKNERSAIGGGRQLNISGFDFNKQGLEAEMSAAKAGIGRDEGIVISHAGSGSILAALRIAVSLIVVPNRSLLDNHQQELAEELEAQGYVIHGHIDYLSRALLQVESHRKTQSTWPPSNESTDPSGRGLVGVMDDELGFVD